MIESFQSALSPAGFSAMAPRGHSKADRMSNGDAQRDHRRAGRPVGKSRKLVPPVGLEPTTRGLKVRCSNLLSYRGPARLPDAGPLLRMVR